MKIHCEEHVLDILARPDIDCSLLWNDAVALIRSYKQSPFYMLWVMSVSEMLGLSASTHTERSTVTTALILMRTLIHETDKTLRLGLSLSSSGT